VGVGARFLILVHGDRVTGVFAPSAITVAGTVVDVVASVVASSW
jgi:hypothetical protein